MRIFDLHAKGGPIGEMRDELIRLVPDTENEARQPLPFQQLDLML
jgi:hypothetical protein